MANQALLTGITGQDGSYLAEFPLDKGYEVHGILHRASSFNTRRIDHLYRDPHLNGIRLFLYHGDLQLAQQEVTMTGPGTDPGVVRSVSNTEPEL